MYFGATYRHDKLFEDQPVFKKTQNITLNFHKNAPTIEINCDKNRPAGSLQLDMKPIPLK